MQFHWKFPLAWATIILLITSNCAPTTPAAWPAILTPYYTPIPSPTLELDMGIPIPETLPPAPTPFTYTIQPGDTMSEIAEQFGVPLETLIAANPNVSPNIMPVGQALLIPVDVNNPTGQPTPTPVPFAVAQIQCHPTLDQGMWCFALARNDSVEALENLSAQISLISMDGKLLAVQTAIPPLNVFPPQTSLPLMAFFPPSVPAGVQPRIQILTASLLPAGDARYLPATLQNTVIEIERDGRTARATGQAVLPTDSPPAKMVWIAAVAYDGAGRVIGVRRWESGAGLLSGGSLGFDFIVASLNFRITKVELFVEARP